MPSKAMAQEKRLPDKMVSHNWGNRFSHLIAAIFADATGKTSFRNMLAWLRLGARGTFPADGPRPIEELLHVYPARPKQG